MLCSYAWPAGTSLAPPCSSAYQMRFSDPGTQPDAYKKIKPSSNQKPHLFRLAKSEPSHCQFITILRKMNKSSICIGTFSAFALSCMLSACGQSQAPITIEAFDPSSPISSARLHITARVDQITIENVQVNRGNCKVRNMTATPLKFGQSTDVFSDPCRVAEVVVTANGQNWKFTF